MRNLEDLYNNIKFYTILTTGRSGSDYLQGCLDNVPGVLTFSGHFHYYKFCENFNIEFEKIDTIRISEQFIKKYTHLFTTFMKQNKYAYNHDAKSTKMTQKCDKIWLTESPPYFHFLF